MSNSINSIDVSILNPSYSAPVIIALWVVGASLIVGGFFLCIKQWKFYSGDNQEAQSLTADQKINMGMPMSFLIGLGIFIALLNPGHSWFIYIAQLLGFIFYGNMAARFIGFAYFGYTKKHLALMVGEALAAFVLLSIDIVTTT